MKKQLFACALLCMVLSSMGQFIPQPLNYPGPGYWPYFISIADPDNVWIGTIQESGLPYSFSVKSNDGGNSWVFDSIPVPGEPQCTSISSWDSSTCFFVFTDISEGGGTIWKTTDGGNTWTNLITTQFTGGFANFYHAFSADTGVAMGDPTGGYFEIQLTNDGGSTWNRVASENIPPPLSGEYGIMDSYSAIGNSVWFATNKGRCYRSADKGQNWNVTQVFSAVNSMFDVCFSTEQKGAFWKADAITNVIALTIDGGSTWNNMTFPTGYSLAQMSRVEGFDGGFVVTAFKSFIDVYFTPDMFTTLSKIGSSIISTGAVSFLDASTGWLAGGESGTNEILKYTGVLSSARSSIQATSKLSIVPNPSVAEALIKFPANFNSTPLDLRISDMRGKVVHQRTIISGTGWSKLDASGFANGIYLVEVKSGSKLLAREKWVVNH